MISGRKSFKKLIRKKKYIFKKLKTDKLIASKFENAKEYWRLLKQAAIQMLNIQLAQNNLLTTLKL